MSIYADDAWLSMTEMENDNMLGEEDNRTVFNTPMLHRNGNNTLAPPQVPMSLQNVLRTLPGEAAERKNSPVMTGMIDYFPLAVAEIAKISKAGNDQHNPGQPLHWARGKSADHADCVLRHLIERGTIDTDGQRHTAKAAWRVLALLQEELEAAAGWHPAK